MVVTNWNDALVTGWSQELDRPRLISSYVCNIDSPLRVSRRDFVPHCTIAASDIALLPLACWGFPTNVHIRETPPYDDGRDRRNDRHANRRDVATYILLLSRPFN